ncbi:MAG: S-adenosylmethionine:tRNA ribosyltransferase-isomerase [Bacteroidales bacterium]|nr:S-adenosylmethionine:tRNA ribosyltransferase-isomerase [Bacteroidales bacterium]
MLSDLKAIRIEDYDYPLPDGRIARYPAPQRDQSKLLCLRGADISEHRFSDLPALLPKDSLLVFNDTRVIHARLRFSKPTGAVIEIFCLEPHLTAISQAFEERSHCRWNCLVGNNKRWRDGVISGQCTVCGQSCTITATRRQADGNTWVIDFDWTGGFSFAEVIENAGQIPLPPYLGREAENDDNTRYQTVYARHDGSVAAPTAGLHFTPAVIESLHRNGIGTEYVTLHVGAGTFKPVSTTTIGEHDMHVEQVQITADNLRRIASHKGPVVAVGTTSVRTLESVYWFGVQLATNPNLEKMGIGQWEPYTDHDDSLPTASEAYTLVEQWLGRHDRDRLDGETRLMIAPGYRYRVAQGLVTNFHQPKSTLLLLVSALVGDRWRDCYRYALDHGFRFLSYGDSCLFLP